jgi:hypothetical protein
MTDEKTRKWIAWCIIIMLIVISTVFGVRLPVIPEPPIEALGYTHFSGLVVTAPTTVATATPGTVINSLGLGNILEIQDASTPVVQIYDGGNLVAKKQLYGACTYSETSTAAQTLTPATNCYILSPANAITITLGTTGMVTGTMLTVANIANQTILIADTALRSHDGAQLSLGQYDVAELVYTGAEWYQLIELANQ